jgi:hypothetical protein
VTKLCIKRATQKQELFDRYDLDVRQVVGKSFPLEGENI